MAADGELARGLVEERWVPLAGHVFLLVLIGVLVWDVAPHRLFALWGAAVVLLAFSRTVLSYHARRGDVRPLTIVRSIRLMMPALGLAWSVGAVIVGRYVPLAVFSIVLMAFAGLLAGAINTLIADRWAFPLYALALFGPTLSARVLLRSGEAGAVEQVLVEQVLIAAFVAFMVVQHGQAHRSLLERIRVEEALRQRERQLAAAQAIAHVGSWEWDITTNAVTWSDELRRMYGVPADAPAGYAEFLAVAHPEDRARLEAIVGEGVRTHQTIDYEWRVVRPDGELRYIQARNVVITDASGQPVRMAGTSRDITERKRAEELERTLLRELQKAVSEVKVLQGILPICASCKRIKDHDGKWEAVESYVRERTNAEFSHGLCPECAKATWGSQG